jgi:hypothetical protein
MIVDVQMAVDTVPPKDLKPDVLEDPSKPYNVRHAALCQLDLEAQGTSCNPLEPEKDKRRMGGLNFEAGSTQSRIIERGYNPSMFGQSHSEADHVPLQRQRL